MKTFVKQLNVISEKFKLAKSNFLCKSYRYTIRNNYGGNYGTGTETTNSEVPVSPKDLQTAVQTLVINQTGSPKDF